MTSPFRSRWEGRLWAAAALAVVAIYASVPLSGLLVQRFGSEAILGAAFAVLLLAAAATVVALGLLSGTGTRTRWVALGVGVCYGMLLVRMGVTPLERSHLFEYGIVAVLFRLALGERARHGPSVPLPGLVAVAAAVLVGWGDEALQAVVPERVYDPRDIVTNALAAIVAVASLEALAWARRRDRG